MKHGVKTMKKIIIAAVLPFAALFATSAMADHHSNHQATHQSKTAQVKQSSHKWRSGQLLPSNYRSASYAVDHRKYRQLSQPGRGQQWYKVKNDYILVNSKDHRIIRIL